MSTTPSCTMSTTPSWLLLTELGALALSPLETRGLYGAAYTAVFVKDAGSAPS